MKIRRRSQLRNFLRNSDFSKTDTPPTFIMEKNSDSKPDITLSTTKIRNNIQNINLNPDLGSKHLAIEFTINTNRNPIR